MYVFIITSSPYYNLFHPITETNKVMLKLHPQQAQQVFLYFPPSQTPCLLTPLILYTSVITANYFNCRMCIDVRHDLGDSPRQQDLIVIP